MRQKRPSHRYNKFYCLSSALLHFVIFPQSSKQGMLDIALLTANASQLRYILQVFQIVIFLAKKVVMFLTIVGWP